MVVDRLSFLAACTLAGPMQNVFGMNSVQKRACTLAAPMENVLR